MANGYRQASRGQDNFNDDYNRGQRGGYENERGGRSYGGDSDYGRDRWSQAAGSYNRGDDRYSSGGSDVRGGGQGGYSQDGGRGSGQSFGGQDRDQNFGGYGGGSGYGGGASYGSGSGGQYDRGSDYGSGRDYQSGGYSGTSGDRYGSSDRDRFGTQSYGQPTGYHQGGNYNNDRGFFEKAGDEVKSWFGDNDAQRRRERDEHRGRGPKNYTRSDDRIREDVSDHLTDDGSLDASDIEVDVSGGEVTLSGHVSSRMDKRRAEDCAYRVSGINHVQNNLRVKDNDWSSGGSNLGSGSTASSSTAAGTSGSTATAGKAGTSTGS